MAARTNRRWAARWCHSCCAPAHSTDWWCSGHGKESAPHLLLTTPGQAIRWETREKGKRSWCGNSCTAMDRQLQPLSKVGWAARENRPAACGKLCLRRWSLSKQRVRMPGFFPKTKPAFCPRNRCKGNCSFLAAMTRILTSVTEAFCSRINPCINRSGKWWRIRELLFTGEKSLESGQVKRRAGEWR